MIHIDGARINLEALYIGGSSRRLEKTEGYVSGRLCSKVDNSEH